MKLLFVRAAVRGRKRCDGEGGGGIQSEVGVSMSVNNSLINIQSLEGKGLDELQSPNKLFYKSSYKMFQLKKICYYYIFLTCLFLTVNKHRKTSSVS